MKLKNLLIAGASCVLTAAIAVGGTLAYLQDDDSDVNVMTTGNVSIVQNEQEWNDSKTELVGFTQNKPLLPYVGQMGWENKDDNNGAYRRFTMNNVIDKYVSVTNDGTTAAFVRTIFAFEMGDYTTVENFRNKVIGISRNSLDGDEFDFPGAWVWGTPFTAQIDGANYMIWEAVHQDAVASGKTTVPSLLQVYMNKAMNNADITSFGDTYEILALSQGVQAAGFADAQTALDTAFGKTAEKAAEWFDGVIVPSVKTLAELREAMANGGEYKLAADINVSSAELLYKADGGHSDGSAFLIKADTVLDLNGHNITIDAPGRAADVFFVNGGHNFTVKGNGTVTADCGIFVAYDSATTINIEGGHYKCTASNDMLYAIWGKLNVSGGTYETAYWNLINIYGQGNISLVDVSGGSFKNWSPASSPDGNLLADGYKVVSEVVDGVTWYTVVAE